MKTTPKQLRSELDQLSNQGIANNEGVAEFLYRISKKENLESLFNEIKSDDDWCVEVANRSYTHDNGFDKIKILRSQEPQYKLRLHIWWPENLPQSEQSVNYHDHRWDFHSILLSGMMKFTNFDVGDNGTEVYEYEYSPVGEDEEYGLNYIGKTHLSHRFGGTLQKGVDYTISNEIVHKTYVPEEELTATLLVQGANQKEEAQVFSGGKLENENIDAHRMTPEELKSKISRLEKEIE